MSRTLVETEWFDEAGWKARLAELCADPPEERRDGLIKEIEAHLAAIGSAPEAPENSPQDALNA